MLRVVPRNGREAAMQADPNARRARRILVALVLLCLAPVIAAYLAYYVIRPQGGTAAYGALIEPQRPIPSGFMVQDETGRRMPLSALQGKWLFVMTDRSACDDACARKLYEMRQVRALQNTERGRVVMVWLRSDAEPVPARVAAAYPDTRALIAEPAAIAAWLPADAGTTAADHIYLVDPHGNLMMRFPRHPDPERIEHDLARLLKWSGIG
jgi:cytochrome oxidase Cu insertion factor (SCO1/SenC/PrrC family)